MDLKLKRVVVTGGEGFLGRHVVAAFTNKDANVWCPCHAGFDLRKRKDIIRMFDSAQPEVVIHLAAAVGGIEANAANPGRFFYDNIVMGAEVMDVSRERGVEKYVQVGTSCSYPANAPTPVKETDLWTGAPNPVTGPYGVAKLALITMAQAYRQQYGLKAITLIPVNLYGPGDSFKPESSHVIPALIMKCIEAKKNNTPLNVWGTGEATREFLYVKEAADAIVLATEKYDKPEPINLGTGQEIFIKDLARAVADAVGFTGEIVWDASKPEGQQRRCFDVSRAKQEFGFKSTLPINEGIRTTVEWYLNEKTSNSSGKR